MNRIKELDGLQKMLVGAVGISLTILVACFAAPTIFDLGGGDTSSACSWAVTVIFFCGGVLLVSRKADSLQTWVSKAPKIKILKLAALVATWFMLLAVFAGGISILFQLRKAAGHIPEMGELVCEEGQLVFAPTREKPEQAKSLTKQEAQELQSLLSKLENGTQKFVTWVDSNALVISLEGNDLSFYPKYLGSPYGYFRYDHYPEFYAALMDLFAGPS